MHVLAVLVEVNDLVRNVQVVRMMPRHRWWKKQPDGEETQNTEHARVTLSVRVRTRGVSLTVASS